MMRNSALAAVAAIAAAATIISDAFQPPMTKKSFIIPTQQQQQQQRIINDPMSFGMIRPSTRMRSSLVEEETSRSRTTNNNNGELGPMPEQDENGIYQIMNKEQHVNFLKNNPDKLIVMKFFAPWCRACKGLEPKYVQVAKSPKFNENIPILFAEMTVQHNKNYVKSLGVLALPSVHFYAGASEGLVENFPCGPSKIPILKKKLVLFINEYVDSSTRLLKTKKKKEDVDLDDVDCSREEMKETEPCRERDIRTATAIRTNATLTDEDVDSKRRTRTRTTTFLIGDLEITESQFQNMRTNIPFFADLTDTEFDTLLSKSTLQSYDPSSIIMRQYNLGTTFYVIESGQVEICVRAGYEDPLSPNYLGAVINRLGPGDYFGERSLITGQPRAASIRAIEKTRCFAFEIKDIPRTSVLAGPDGTRNRASDERMAVVDEKYGVDVVDDDDDFKAMEEAHAMNLVSAANMNRGSANSPNPIQGVDVNLDLDDDDDDLLLHPEDDIQQVSPSASKEAIDLSSVSEKNDGTILSLLLRFKLIRHAARCFEYIIHTQPKWGDVGEQRRRSILVSKLTSSQRQEFIDVFQVMDTNNDGIIQVNELKRAMESVGEADVIFMNSSSENGDDKERNTTARVGDGVEIALDEFLGIMAEAEFYYLFKETFYFLDKDKTGFVLASELDRVLCGMRDLVSDDRNSIIDVEDDDMMIDYEHFSRMLLGADI